MQELKKYLKKKSDAGIEEMDIKTNRYINIVNEIKSKFCKFYKFKKIDKKKYSFSFNMDQINNNNLILKSFDVKFNYSTNKYAELILSFVYPKKKKDKNKIKKSICEKTTRIKKLIRKEKLDNHLKKPDHSITLRIFFSYNNDFETFSSNLYKLIESMINNNKNKLNKLESIKNRNISIKKNSLKNKTLKNK